ncbi:MAG: HEAT repeat domain-containing protein [Kiritimatiellia bacterium]|jgi:hypothetical protein
MSAKAKVLLLIGAAILIAGVLFFATQNKKPSPPSEPHQEAVVSNANSVPQVSPQHQSTHTNTATAPTALQDITELINGSPDLASARHNVVQEMKSRIDNGQINIADLEKAIVDSSTPVEARIIFAEAIIGLLADQANRLDVQSLSEALASVESPLLATRMIDLLGLTEDPEALSAIRAKCAMEAENVRLAGVRAAKRIKTTAAAKFLVACTEDPSFYRVRIQALHGVASTHRSQPPLLLS